MVRRAMLSEHGILYRSISLHWSNIKYSALAHSTRCTSYRKWYSQPITSKVLVGHFAKTKVEEVCVLNSDDVRSQSAAQMSGTILHRHYTHDFSFCLSPFAEDSFL